MNISFIIPVFNTPEIKLEKCIDSIMDNKLENNSFEIIIVDDGSRPYVGALCSKYQSKNFLYVYQSNQGVSAARNKGIEIAKGKYLFFVDADDTLRLEELKGNIIRSNYDIIIYDMVVKRKSDEKGLLWTLPDEEGKIRVEKIIFYLLKSDTLNSVCAKLIRKSFLVENKIKFNRGQVNGEDEDFVIKVFENSPSTFYVKHAIYNYNLSYVSRTTRSTEKAQVVMNDFIKNFIKKKKLISSIESVAWNTNLRKYLECIIENKLVKDLTNVMFDLATQKKSFIGIEEHEKKFFCEYISLENLNFLNKMRYFIILKKRTNFIIFIGFLRLMYLKTFK
ncbi:glycosyltransferase family 2 protein [Liquorilactobacillus satsumensis]|uniref:glycosyltransferase family 2 protein n=2 Tax=Liquorilactobacillus satsumensis TaxID=259059 RepID=UPI001E2D5993|nr:glycosyltransferase family 2 protein [Liquorilactobacillus satsumensis]MCC7667100.1 hypothetical protein [Liquorilactobacillus satsumensis]MCP9358242.1 glycosyltransferase family 2 protein [Liquorilactobacillus satsumensis]MCP9372196.1 glycosyltransferase family 2 protein [Liquorilactobacillus satsumensis]